MNDFFSGQIAQILQENRRHDSADAIKKEELHAWAVPIKTGHNVRCSCIAKSIAR